MNQSTDHQSHSLIDRTLDEDGVVDKYKEFHKIDFGNSFGKLEKPDYEIRATESKKEDDMRGTREKRVASYVSKLTSGYDATVQDDYQAGDVNGQAGKAQTEAVAPANNWENDKRDAVGRAASTLLRRVATRINKLADIYEKNGEDLETLEKEADDEFEELHIEAAATGPGGHVPDGTGPHGRGMGPGNGKGDGSGLKANEEEDEEDKEACKKEATTEKEAVHPIEHDTSKDDPKADMPAQTGDDEWVDIGPGSFNDKRDEAGRAKETGQ